jgi:hypothetical protein
MVIHNHDAADRAGHGFFGSAAFPVSTPTGEATPERRISQSFGNSAESLSYRGKPTLRQEFRLGNDWVHGAKRAWARRTLVIHPAFPRWAARLTPS